MVINSTIVALWLALTPPVAQRHATNTSPAAEQNSQPSDPLAGAEALLQKQQYAEAAEKLEVIVGRHANNPQAWFDLGFAQSHLDKLQDAAATYRKAVDLAPTWFEANLNLGIALAKAGNTAAAVPVLKHAVELKPSTGGQQALGRAWLALAHAQEDTAPKEAIAAYEKAATMLPGDSDLDVNVGNLLEKTGDLAGAEQSFRQAAEMGNAAGISRVINLLGKQKRYDEAAVWLQKYVAQNPQNSRARLELARLLASQDKPQDAIAVLQPVSGAADPAINRELGDLYRETRQFALAAPLYQQLLAANPNDPDLHLGLGISLLYQLKYAEAEQELLKTVKLKADYAEAYDRLADAARENKHYGLALQALDARAKFLPENPKTYFIRATSYDNLRMTKQAMTYYKKFLEVAGGKYPDQEFEARHRLKALQPE